MRRAAFITLGCKLNASDTERLKSQFFGRGYRIVPFEEPADIYVINTCTVTERADSDSRQMIRQAIRNKEDGSLVVATGCYAQRDPETLSALQGVDLVLGQREKSNLLHYVEERLEQKGVSRKIIVSDNPDLLEFIDFDTRIVGAWRHGATPLRTRATLKIQDGCDEHCTFCIVPGVRGRSRSRPLSQILEEARRFVNAGYREIALTGVNTGLYGKDLEEEVSLLDVVEGLERIPGIRRIRMNSLEPNYSTLDLIDFAANSEKICRHFHIPLQSGDDTILRRMGRRYGTRDYRDLIETIERKIPDCCIGADVMVGFHGEGDPHFENTFRLIEDLPITYLHVFTYSEREGTPAVRMAGRVHPRVKGERSQRLRELSRKKRKGFHNRFLDRTLDILVEEKKEGPFLTGLSDNYIRVRLDGKEEWLNEMVPTRIIEVRSEFVYGDPVMAC